MKTTTVAAIIWAASLTAAAANECQGDVPGTNGVLGYAYSFTEIDGGTRHHYDHHYTLGETVMTDRVTVDRAPDGAVTAQNWTTTIDAPDGSGASVGVFADTDLLWIYDGAQSDAQTGDPALAWLARATHLRLSQTIGTRIEAARFNVAEEGIAAMVAGVQGFDRFDEACRN